jgi:spermidine synthase
MTPRKLLPLAVAAALALCLFARAEQRVLYEKASPFNTIVVTEDSRGLRTLWFERNGVRQSVVKVGDPDHLELPYARAMPVGLVFAEKPQRVLIVGLGGGTIPCFLHKHYPKTTIDVVEIDPGVVEVAKSFFGFREDATLRAHVADGRRFIEKCRDPYDIIFLDAFGSDNIPHSLTTREFLQAVRRALKPQGIAVGNVWSRYSNPLYDSMVRTYQDVFEELRVVDVRGAGNKILLALPQKRDVSSDEVARRARRISREKDFPYDLGDVVAYGYREPQVDGSRGRVLTDDDPAESPR